MFNKKLLKTFPAVTEITMTSDVLKAKASTLKAKAKAWTFKTKAIGPEAKAIKFGLEAKAWPQGLHH